MEAVTKRIFIGAFTHTQPLQNGLLELQKEWQPHLRARWTKPENLHLTAYFYGNATLSEIQQIKEVLHRYINIPLPVNAAVKGIDFFTKNKNRIFFIFAFSINIRQLSIAFKRCKSSCIAINLSTVLPKPIRRILHWLALSK